MHDEPVTVKRDEEDGQCGRVHRDGERGEDGVTQKATKHPLVGELVVQLQGEAEDTQDDVRDGETRDEQVRDVAHLGVLRDDVDDDAVADDAEDDDKDVERDDEASPQRVTQDVKVRVVDVHADLLRPVEHHDVIRHCPVR